MQVSLHSLLLLQGFRLLLLLLVAMAVVVLAELVVLLLLLVVMVIVVLLLQARGWVQMERATPSSQRYHDRELIEERLCALRGVLISSFLPPSSRK